MVLNIIFGACILNMHNAISLMKFVNNSQQLVKLLDFGRSKNFFFSMCVYDAVPCICMHIHVYEFRYICTIHM